MAGRRHCVGFWRVTPASPEGFRSLPVYDLFVGTASYEAEWQSLLQRFWSIKPRVNTRTRLAHVLDLSTLAAVN